MKKVSENMCVYRESPPSAPVTSGLLRLGMAKGLRPPRQAAGGSLCRRCDSLARARRWLQELPTDRAASYFERFTAAIRARTPFTITGRASVMSEPETSTNMTGTEKIHANSMPGEMAAGRYWRRFRAIVA